MRLFTTTQIQRHGDVGRMWDSVLMEECQLNQHAKVAKLLYLNTPKDFGFASQKDTTMFNKHFEHYFVSEVGVYIYKL